MTIPTSKQFFEKFRKFRTDKGELHGYNYMYNAVFQKIGEPSKMLEIGIKQGYSICAWKDIFPQCEVVGVDINERDDIVSRARENTLHFCDSLDPTIKDVVGTGYDIIIDDGSHRLRDQWQTFLNLEGCWNKAYVIEDLEGIHGDEFLREELPKRGYNYLQLYDSQLKNVPMTTSRGIVNVNFYAMVIYREPHPVHGPKEYGRK